MPRSIMHARRRRGGTPTCAVETEKTLTTQRRRDRLVPQRVSGFVESLRMEREDCGSAKGKASRSTRNPVVHLSTTVGSCARREREPWPAACLFLVCGSSGWRRDRRGAHEAAAANPHRGARRRLHLRSTSEPHRRRSRRRSTRGRNHAAAGSKPPKGRRRSLPTGCTPGWCGS
jgi:hypothetical protein